MICSQSRRPAMLAPTDRWQHQHQEPKGDGDETQRPQEFDGKVVPQGEERGAAEERDAAIANARIVHFSRLSRGLMPERRVRRAIHRSTAGRVPGVIVRSEAAGDAQAFIIESYTADE